MSYLHIADTTPKAQKSYQCYLCCGDIGKGTIHVKRSFVDEDGPDSARMHAECEKLTQKWDVNDWESFSPGEGGFLVELEEALAAKVVGS